MTQIPVEWKFHFFAFLFVVYRGKNFCLVKKGGQIDKRNFRELWTWLFVFALSAASKHSLKMCTLSMLATIDNKNWKWEKTIFLCLCTRRKIDDESKFLLPFLLHTNFPPRFSSLSLRGDSLNFHLQLWAVESWLKVLVDVLWVVKVMSHCFIKLFWVR